MIAIQKKSEPEGLAQLRQKAIDEELSPKEAYALLRNPLKEQVRDRPVEEQGQICAYCMCRIPRQDADPVITPIILEHMVPRSPGDGRNIGQIIIILLLYAMGTEGRMEAGQCQI